MARLQIPKSRNINNKETNANKYMILKLIQQMLPNTTLKQQHTKLKFTMNDPWKPATTDQPTKLHLGHRKLWRNLGSSRAHGVEKKPRSGAKIAWKTRLFGGGGGERREIMIMLSKSSTKLLELGWTVDSLLWYLFKLRICARLFDMPFKTSRKKAPHHRCIITSLHLSPPLTFRKCIVAFVWGCVGWFCFAKPFTARQQSRFNPRSCGCNWGLSIWHSLDTHWDSTQLSANSHFPLQLPRQDCGLAHDRMCQVVSNCNLNLYCKAKWQDVITRD